jgi:hypothetical protein
MEEKMKTMLAIILAASLFGAGAAQAQPANSQPPSPPSTPTTKILAIGTLNPGVDPQAALAILPMEVRETAKLYLDGKIEQWFSQQERRGVVFVLNMTDKDAAREMLEKLPLGQAHLMTFELMPIGPLNPLRLLLAPPPAAK